MKSPSHRMKSVAVFSAAVLFSAASVAEAAMDPRFELDQQALEGVSSTSRVVRKAVKRPAHRVPVDRDKWMTRSTVYTVKPGDHLFKILMRDYGLSNDQAESLIDEVRRENNINDIRRLQVGQKIIIPAMRRSTSKSSTDFQAKNEKEEFTSAEESLVGVRQALRLEASVSPQLDRETTNLKEVWDKMVPAGADIHAPLSFQSPSFSLILDSQRYPVYASMDGTRIVVDPTESIPPLVRSLITEKDPSIRIVSGSSDKRQFLADMLKSAGFYSVEEDVSVSFGSDPKLVVTSDFKVEKTSESFMKQDVFLLNSSEKALPASLSIFLEKEGFTVHEPFVVQQSFLPVLPNRQIYQVTAKDQAGVVDALLKALSVDSHEDRRLDVFGSDNNGISLSVKAERYFERDGRRYVITRFDGDPVNYTLFRILETKGYQVVILDAQDSFRKISEKILARLNLHGNFARHSLLSGEDVNYAVEMSGFKIEGDDIPGGSLFLTDVQLDRVVYDILRENGFKVHKK